MVPSWTARVAASATPPITSDSSGPAAETSSSRAGVGGSSAISLTPPSRCSVIRRTGSPSRSAVSAWPSSWTKTDA